MGTGELLDVDRLEIRRPQLQHLGSQQETAAVAGHVPELLKGEQAAPGGGGGNPRAACDVAQTECRVVAAEGADDGEALGEAAHHFTADGGRASRYHGIDTLWRGGPVSFRIPTSVSIYESSTTRGNVKIGRQDQRSSGISTSNADTIVVRGRDLAAELVGTITFT